MAEKMQPYEWMVKYTPQTEWIQRRGVLLWLAFFFIEVGAGMFFVASILHILPAMLAGWLICAALGGGLHLLFLGRPVRVWRMLISSGWKTSWISRGLFFVSIFLILGLIEIGLFAWSDVPLVLLIITNIVAFLTVVYAGFAMNFVNGIALWNTALLPVLYIVSGLLGGADLTLGVALIRGDSLLGASIESWVRILLTGFITLIPIYLISIRYSSSAGKSSVKLMLEGPFARLFWVIAIFAGMVIPAAVIIYSLINGFESIPVFFLYVAILSGLAGDLAMRYLILRCGLYNPLIQTIYSQNPG